MNLPERQLYLSKISHTKQQIPVLLRVVTDRPTLPVAEEEAPFKNP
jgi:hypothetical protein